MLPAAFDAIAVSDIDALVANEVSEGTRLDLKEATYADNENREFALDVASFANTLGGDIVLGVAEAAGIAVDAPGLKSALDLDKQIQRFDSILQASIDPRIPGVRIRAVRDGARGFIVVRIPRNVWGLHMVTAGGGQRFFARNNGGKYPLDVHQIRAGFLAGGELVDRAASHHHERTKYLADVGDPQYRAWKKFVIAHFVPLASFVTEGSLDVLAVRREGGLLALYPSGVNLRLNIDGVLAENEESYSLLFRNGVLETASTAFTKRDSIPSHTLVQSLIDSLGRYVALSRRFGIPAPIAVFVTLHNVHEGQMAVPAHDLPSPASYEYRFDRAVVRLPSVILESLDSDLALALRPMMDALWQAVGSDLCSYFDTDGRFKRYN